MSYSSSSPGRPDFLRSSRQWISWVSGCRHSRIRYSKPGGSTIGIDELATVRLVERSPGTWRIDDGGSGRHDDRVISLALAAHHLLTQSGRRGARLVGAFRL